MDTVQAPVETGLSQGPLAILVDSMKKIMEIYVSETDLRWHAENPQIFVEAAKSFCRHTLRRAANAQKAVEQAQKYIEEHLHEKLKMSEIAKVAGLSPYYFCKRFNEAVGMTFTRYVNIARIQRAKRFLANPHENVSQAAFAAGFQSFTHFNRVYKVIEGETPSDYRNRTKVTREAKIEQAKELLLQRDIPFGSIWVRLDYTSKQRFEEVFYNAVHFTPHDYRGIHSVPIAA